MTDNNDRREVPKPIKLIPVLFPKPNTANTPGEKLIPVLMPMPGQSKNPAARNDIQYDAKVFSSPKPSTSEPTTTTLPQTNDQKKLKPANVIIFNHQKFDDPKKKLLDNGKDVEALTKVFGYYKCCVQKILDATLKEVEETVQELKNANFEEHSALVMVFLSHGSRNNEIAAKDKMYSLHKVILNPLLSNKTLANKPKIVFSRAEKGVLEEYQTDNVKLPSPTGLFICYSTFERFTHQEQESGGSTFIQTLCEALERDGKTKDIHTIVNELQVIVKNNKKRIISLHYTLTEKYIFGGYMDN